MVAFPLISLAVFGLDGLGLLLATCIVGWFRAGADHIVHSRDVAVAILASAVFLATCWKRSGYDTPGVLGVAPLLRSCQVPLLASGLVALGLCLVLPGNPDALSWSVMWTGAAGCLILALRSVAALCVTVAKARGWLRRRVAILDLGCAAQSVASSISARHAALTQLVDAVSPAADQGQQGRLEELIVSSRDVPIRSIIVTGARDATEIDAVCVRLRSVVADVYLAQPASAVETMLTRSIEEWEVRPLMLRPLDFWQRTQKLVFDKVASLILLGFLSPLFVGVAIAIKLDSSGPIFFKQPRVGFNNVRFTMFKFRSMYHDQEDLLCGHQTSRDDPRVTPVGKVIRRLSLDEIPQILNVLLGDMSLVGPRPHAPSTQTGGLLLEEMVPTYAERHIVRPGLTGLAQVSGARGEVRSLEQIEKRVSLDLAYIAQWSLWLDVKILWLTLAKELVSSRAY